MALWGKSPKSEESPMFTNDNRLLLLWALSMLNILSGIIRADTPIESISEFPWKTGPSFVGLKLSNCTLLLPK